jgi:hypothetical protein
MAANTSVNETGTFLKVQRLERERPKAAASSPFVSAATVTMRSASGTARTERGVTDRRARCWRRRPTASDDRRRGERLVPHSERTA